MKIKKTETESGKTMMLEDSWSWKRFYMILAIAGAGMAEAVLAGIWNKSTRGTILAVLFCSILFSVIFILELETYRLNRGWFHEKANNYVRIGLIYGACCTAGVIFQILPAYVQPVLVLAAAITIVSNPFLGILGGIFQVVILSVIGQHSVYQVICAVLLTSCGCIIVSFLEEKESRIWAGLVIGMFVMGGTIIFSYLETSQVSKNVISYGLCNGILSALGTIGIYQWLETHISKAAEHDLERIVSEEFELVQAVKSFSRADYEHAKKVSEISGACAAALDADVKVAEAGGFYYRLGRMEGEPYVENGVKLAKSNYFPMQVVQILSEYNGEQKLPSTVESAVVHIVDSVVTKFDVLDKNTLSNSWNQDILVYQTLNENSAAGLYDQAGFSMNMFLKIRDYLIKEAKLQ